MMDAVWETLADKRKCGYFSGPWQIMQVVVGWSPGSCQTGITRHTSHYIPSIEFHILEDFLKSGGTTPPIIRTDEQIGFRRASIYRLEQI